MAPATHRPSPRQRRTAPEGPQPVRWTQRSDLLCALAQEHRDLDALGRWLLARDDAHRPPAAVGRFLVQLTVHEVCEQVLVDPLVRRPLGRPDLADLRSGEERALLTTADTLRDAEEVPDDALRELIGHLVEHSDREELEVFPLLRHALKPGDLVAGWHGLTGLRRRLPRRSAETHGPPADAWRSPTALQVARALTSRSGAPPVG